MRKYKIASSAKEADKDRSDHGDDWETDPNFQRDMTEIDQRWGSKRTVGSINMSQLIKEVHKDHELLTDKYGHESQKDHSAGFGGKFGIQKDRKDGSAFDFGHHEKLSKHTSQEINNKSEYSSSSRGIIKNYQESIEKKGEGDNIEERKTSKINKEIFERASGSSGRPTPEPKSSQAIKDRMNTMSSKFESEFLANGANDTDTKKKSFIDEQDMPRSIKSMSEKFEKMCKESRDNFRKITEERRKEFFNEIKSQVKETRKGYDGFDTPEDTTDGPKVTVRKFREEVQTKIVKEGDKIVQEETKRNVESSSSHNDKEDINADHPQSTISSSSGVSLKATTLYDYEAADDDEISFDVDDLITDIEKVDSGWYKGTVKRNGKVTTGLFPANYVRLLNDTD